jgi:hypothetical protein
MLRDEPRQLPPLWMMLEDLGKPPAKLARALGVSLRTLQRWIAADQAPRPAALAIFWATSWGRSIIECDAHNQARQALGLAACLQRENARLQRELARVVAAGDFGAANRPLFRPLRGPAPLPVDPVPQAWQRADDDGAQHRAAHD